MRAELENLCPKEKLFHTDYFLPFRATFLQLIKPELYPEIIGGHRKIWSRESLLFNLGFNNIE